MATRRISFNDLKGGSIVQQNVFLSVQMFQSLRLVVLTRTSQAFQTVSEVDQCTAELCRAVPRHGRAEFRIVVDMRLAPMRVFPFLDPAFERFRRETEAAFLAGVAIVTTPLGRIRAERLSGQTEAPLRVVGSMEEALSFLCAEGDEDRTPAKQGR